MVERRSLTASAVLLVLLFARQPTRPAPGVASGAYWTATVEGDLTTLAVADLDRDGWAEILGGTDKGKVVVWRPDGQLLWEFAVETDWVTGLSSADLDGDGLNEVLATAAGILPTNYLYVLDAYGSLLWSHSLREELWSLLPLNTDDDPALELLLAARRPRVLDNDGTELPGWQAELLRTPHLRLADWDNDGAPEVVSVRSGSLNIIEVDGSGQTLPLSIRGEIEAVEVGDVDADGVAESIVLTDSALVLLGNQGGLKWAWPVVGVAGEFVLIGGSAEASGQGRILVATALGVSALAADGREVWTFDAGLPAGQALTLAANENSLIVGTEEGQAYLLDANGQVLMEYDVGTPISLAQVADLNGDGYPEVLLAAGGDLSVFGGPIGEPELRGRWLYLAHAPVVALEPSDVDQDRRAEVFLGDRTGGVTLLDRRGDLQWQRELWNRLSGMAPYGAGGFLAWANSALHRYSGQGRLIWEVETQGSIRAAAAVPGGLAVLTEDGDIHLIESADGRLLRTIDLRSPARDLAVYGESILVITEDDAVAALDLQGAERWRTNLGRPGSTFAAVQAGDLLIRSGGHLSWLEGSGAVAWDWAVEPTERLTSAHLGRSLLAVGTDSRVVALDRQGVVVWSRPFEEVVSVVAVLDIEADGMEEVGVGTVKGKVVMLSAVGEEIWQASGRDRVNVLASADLDGNGLSELVVAFEDGVVAAYGLASNQPPWLGNPALTAVGDGYQYAVQVEDPDGDRVEVVLEIWDPSDETWVLQGPAVAASGEGTLTWNVPNPFDTWDADEDSAFRFTWYDDRGSGTTAGSPGPLEIPMDPWYLTYGRITGLVALIAAVPTLLTVIVRRTHAHRRSPLGQAEAALLRLTLDPRDTLAEVNWLLSDLDRAKLLLEHLPGLAREAGDAALGDLLEGVHLAFTRSEPSGGLKTGVLVESLRTISDALRQLSEVPQAEDAREAYLLLAEALEVSSVHEISKLRVRLDGVGARLQAGDPQLATAGSVLSPLGGVARILQALERAESSGDRILRLAEAAADLGQLDRDTTSMPGGLEPRVATAVINHWLRLVTEALGQMRGRAEIDLGLYTRQLVLRERATLGITLSNTGRSPATDVTVELTSCDGLLPSAPPAMVSVLAPGGSERLEMPARSAGSVGDFEIAFQVKWADRESTHKQASFVSRIRFLPAPGEFVPIPNLYATGRPLGPGSPLFVGRDDLFEFVEEKLKGGHIILLVGERRMGKTSLLRQLPSRLGDVSTVAYLDCQGLALEGGLAGWLADAALEISRSVGQLHSPSPSDLSAQPGPAFEAYLRRVVDGLPEGRRLLLLLDEFEEIEACVRAGDLPTAIFRYLRHLMQFGEAAFLLAGTQRLEKLSSEHWAPLLNIGVYREIGPLDEEAARQLIVEPVQGKLLFDDLAVDKLLRLTGRNPYFLQLLCHSVVAHCNSKRFAYVTAGEMDMAVAEALVLGQAHLRFLWEGVSKGGREALAALARLTTDGEPRTPAAVASRLAALGRDTEEPGLLEILTPLTDRGLLQRSFDDQYRFTADLFRIWVEQRGTLGPSQPF